MMLTEKSTQGNEWANFSETKHEPTSLISLQKLLQILSRGKKVRTKFVESHLDKSIAYQIRALRDQNDWTQAEFAEKLGIKYQNNVSARLENPDYGKHSLSTLKKIAASCDVALVVWFIPFSRFLKWATGTPFRDNGLSESFYQIASFTEEFGNTLSEMGPVPADEIGSQHINKWEGAAGLANQRIPPARHIGPVQLEDLRDVQAG
jgi:transcriptional regulator with XRE-family HTH domain